MLPHLIGSVFFQKKKQPIVIDVRTASLQLLLSSALSIRSYSVNQVTKKNLKLQIERAKKCTLLYVAAGSCSMLRFGNSKFSVEKNAENLAAAVEQMIKSLPGKHKNIQVRASRLCVLLSLAAFHALLFQALSIKTNDSIAIPIFTSLPDRDAVATAAGLAARS
jgi:ribosome biogenesis protein UTP30